MRAPWERDKTFCSVAAIAWPDDLAQAKADVNEGYGKSYSRRQAARSKMKLRWEGFTYFNIVEANLLALKHQVSALDSALDKMLARLKASS